MTDVLHVIRNAPTELQAAFWTFLEGQTRTPTMATTAETPNRRQGVVMLTSEEVMAQKFGLGQLNRDMMAAGSDDDDSQTQTGAAPGNG